jgi:hypothetical protein
MSGCKNLSICKLDSEILISCPKPVLKPALKHIMKIRFSGVLLLAVLFLSMQDKVLGQQTATITGAVAVCQNATSPFITFTATGGVAPYEFTYTINGITQSPVITLGEENSATVSVLTSTVGSLEYVLTNVTDAVSNTFTITTPVAIITVNPLPTATITGNLTSCGTTLLTAVTDALSPVYTWYKDNVVIDGQTASTLVVSASGKFKVKIVSGSTSCEKISDESNVTINPLPATSAIWHQ